MTEPGEEKQKKLIIEGNWVRLDRKGAEDKPATSREWRLIRALLRGEPVHWSDGFVIFDSWRNGRQKESYRNQFWRIQSKVPEKLQAKPYGILVKMDHPRGKPEWWKFSPRGEQVLESNIKDAVNFAQRGQEKFLGTDPETGWALIKKSYETYPDAISICRALAYADCLPKNPEPHENCLRGIKALLQNHRDVLLHALFKILCLSSPERQGITVEIAESAMGRWIGAVHQIRQVLLLISGHSFSKPAASTVAIEEFARLVEKYRECIDYVAELKRKYRDGNEDAEKELGPVENEVADFLRRLLHCDAVDRAVEIVISDYKELPHRHIDDHIVLEHRKAAISAFLERSDLLLDNPNALYSQFRIYFRHSVDTFDRKDGIINVIESNKNKDEKWEQFRHVLESMEDEEEAKKELRQHFGITVQQLGRPCDGTPIPAGVVSSEKDLYRLLTVEEVLETKNPPPARWFREGGQVYSDFKQEKFYRRPEAEAVEKKILSNRFFLLEGEAATAKTTIVRTIMYDLHEARERKIYYFDVARRRSFDEDLLIRSIRSVPGLFITENVHLEPRKVQWIYERFEKDPDRRFLLTWRRPDKEFQDPEAKKLYEIPKLTLEPFTEIDRLIDSYCSDPDTPAVVRQKCQDILNVSKKDFWLLACALQGCGDTHGQGDPLSWIANKVETRLVGLETCDDPHADQYPEIIVALSALYKNEVLTTKSYLKKLGFSRAALNGLVRRGEITWQEGPDNNIFYGLHHSTLADAYWEHGGKYIEDAKLQDYEEFIYDYSVSGVPNGLQAILRAGKEIAHSLVRRLCNEEAMPNIVEHEHSFEAISKFFFSYCCFNLFCPFRYNYQDEFLNIIARKLQEEDDIHEVAAFLHCIRDRDSAVANKIWARFNKKELAQKMSQSLDFKASVSCLLFIGRGNPMGFELCRLLDLQTTAKNIGIADNMPDACAFICEVFKANKEIGQELWSIIDRRLLAEQISKLPTRLEILLCLAHIGDRHPTAGREISKIVLNTINLLEKSD
jgi:hypothetical protein